MSPVKVPGILNRIARAGAAGMPRPETESERQELALCLRYGMPLETAGNGVRLPDNQDLLVPALIEEETPAFAWRRLQVAGFFEIGSTNEEAVRRARQGAETGLLVCSESQSAGRGRQGRRWESPAAGGVYVSLIVHPEQPVAHWPLLSLAASSALAAALTELSGDLGISPALDPELKWPNDVLLSGKKTAGILIETAHGRSAPPAAVIGVGINVKPVQLPADLENLVTCVAAEAGVPAPRRRLLVGFLSHFQRAYLQFEKGDFQTVVAQWKSFSRMWNATPVRVVEGGRVRSAVTAGLTESGALMVRNEDGAEEILLAADVSIRISGNGN